VDSRKALTWATDLDDLIGLQFPKLVAFEMGRKVQEYPLHPMLAASMTRLVRKVVHGAVGLKTFVMGPLFRDDEEMEDTALEATRVITGAFPPR